MREWPSEFACRRSADQRRGSDATECRARSQTIVPVSPAALRIASPISSTRERTSRAIGMIDERSGSVKVSTVAPAPRIAENIVTRSR